MLSGDLFVACQYVISVGGMLLWLVWLVGDWRKR
jgi:hypothetical protein